MSDPIAWSDFPELTEDHITIELDRGWVPAGYIQLQLVLGRKVSWGKELFAWDVSGRYLESCRVFDRDRGPRGFTVKTSQLGEIQLAKALPLDGGPVAFYALTDFAGKDGARITFIWNRD
jgi:hypothetical protein